MGLVDYSDSGSDSDSEPTPRAEAASKSASSSTAKKPFQRIVDRSNPGKIQVSLPSASGSTGTASSSDEPPAKRARTTEGGGRFRGFSSFLPPPKAAAVVSNQGSVGKSTDSPSSALRAAPRPGILLRTSAEAAFSRDGTSNYGEMGEELNGSNTTAGGSAGSRLTLPSPKSHAQPSIPPDMKPAEEVKLVGKPLMFKPLSVAKKPGMKKAAGGAQPGAASKPLASKAAVEGSSTEEAVVEVGPAPTKVSLFSFAGDSDQDRTKSVTRDDGYDPSPGELETGYEQDHVSPSMTVAASTPSQQQVTAHQPTLSTLADSMNLSAAARRELFGRNGPGASSSAKVVNFDMEAEYAANQALRSSGEADQQATYNPVRAIATGKHSLRQIVDAVQNQTGALEESFALNRSKQREAAGRYGWK
jgi:hypothetical protein